MRVVKIRAYKYEELNEGLREKVAHDFYDMEFDYESEDSEGNAVMEYDYFADWDLEHQIEFCEMNDYLFDTQGEMIQHLIIK